MARPIHDLRASTGGEGAGLEGRRATDFRLLMPHTVSRDNPTFKHYR
jgi:hypothetical protein